MPDFVLPDLGEGLTEAEIIAWHVRVGDEVRVDQTVVEVETAKASVEVPVPFAGTVSALHGAPGETVPVGAPLLSITPAGFAEPGIVTPDAADTADEGSGNVLIGYGTSAARRRRQRRPHRSRRQPVAVPSAPEAEAPEAEAPQRVAVVSPLVRRMARQSGVDLTALRGSGPSGLILRRDVEHAMQAPRVDATVTRIPLRGMRKTVADNLSRSRREIPEATVWVDVDATGLLDARAQINARSPDEPVSDACGANREHQTGSTIPASERAGIGEPVSVLALIARFAIAGLSRYPELNARIEGDDIVLNASVGLGFAAQTDRGLVVPVIRNAQSMSVRGLSAALAQATAGAREGRATPADLSGGTFTVNNYGVFGVDGSAAIINHPEVAILGIGRIIDRPWVVDRELAVRKVTQLTLAFDHRVCDGRTAGGFLRYVADCVESPIGALADL